MPATPNYSYLIVGRALVLAGLLWTALPGGPDARAQSVRGHWNGPYGSVLDDQETARLGEEGLTALYDMQFTVAERRFAAIAERHPGHPIGSFMQGLITWWKILPDLAEDDRSHDDAFYRAMDETLDRVKRLERSGQYPFDVIFFGAAARGFRGRLLSNRNAWFRAARDGKEALKPVFSVAERDPDNPDFGFGKAVYDYFAAVIPEEYPIVRPLLVFFPEGDREAGMAGLERAAASARFVATEAAYFLLQIHYQYRPDYQESLRWVAQLRERHPANGYFHLLEGRVFARWGRWDDAARVMEEVVAATEANRPGYTDGLLHQALYFLGRSYSSLNRNPDALAAYARLDRLTRDQRPEPYFRVWGRLRTGMVHDVAGRRADALAAYREVLKMEKRGDSRDRAKRYIKTPFGS